MWGDEGLSGEMTARNIEALLQCATSTDRPWVHSITTTSSSTFAPGLFYKEEDSTTVSIKVHGIMRCQISKLLTYILDLNKRKEWDRLTSGEVKVTIDDWNDIVWQCIVDPRIASSTNGKGGKKDLSLLRSWRVGNGVAVVSSHSVVHALVPPVDGFERSEVLSSGFIITQMSKWSTAGSFLILDFIWICLTLPFIFTIVLYIH